MKKDIKDVKNKRKKQAFSLVTIVKYLHLQNYYNY